MQPTMVIRAPKGGMIYINGRFAGECGGELPLMRAVSPTGAIYIEYRPFSSDYRAMTRRLVFSGGYPLEQSLENDDRLRILLWPGNITEIELLPPEWEAPPPAVFEAGGKSFIIDAKRRLLHGGKPVASLPMNAEIPQYIPLPQGAVLLGRCGTEMYLLAADAAFSAATGFLQAKNIEVEPDGRIRALIDHGDMTGHASLETLRLTNDGLQRISVESAWAQGAPRWPQTPSETVRAAIEATIAAQYAEAEGYLSPALRQNSPLENIAERCDLCVEMKYALPSGQAAVGLMKLKSDTLATVEPLFYHVSPSGGLQGPYQIDSLSLDTPPAEPALS